LLLPIPDMVPLDEFAVEQLEQGAPIERALLQTVRDRERCADPDVLVQPIRAAAARSTVLARQGAPSESSVTLLGIADMTARRLDTLPSRLPRRPRDGVWRAFLQAVRGRFEAQDLGEPTADDLADLSRYCGVEQGAHKQVRKRWADRLRIEQSEKLATQA
jgi:hypothetical protein